MDLPPIRIRRSSSAPLSPVLGTGESSTIPGDRARRAHSPTHGAAPQASSSGALLPRTTFSATADIPQQRPRAASLPPPVARQAPAPPGAWTIEAVNAWAIQGGKDELRATAVRGIKAWVKENDPEEPLDLAGLNLKQLPPLPAGVRSLMASDNELTCLPGELPAALAHLDVSNNLLEFLPASWPTGLQCIQADNNRLGSLPSTFPDALTELYASHNRLTSLPDLSQTQLESLSLNHNQLTELAAPLPATLIDFSVASNKLTQVSTPLPPALQYFRISNNQLTEVVLPLPSTFEVADFSDNQIKDIPQALVESYTDCRVLLHDNPLTAHSVLNFNYFSATPDYNGAALAFEAKTQGELATQRLAESIVVWQNVDKAAQWARATQPPADTPPKEAEERQQQQIDFSLFLDALRETVNYSPELEQDVGEWLDALLQNQPLLDKSLLVAQHATVSCEDLVSLTYGDMQTVRTADAVENGAYDERLPELLPLARIAFRKDRLKAIAREKISQLRIQLPETEKVDEVEVYHGYQVQLNTALKLELKTPEMRWFSEARLTKDDLGSALTQVKADEASGFETYLVNDWAPWDAWLKRQDPTGHAALQADTHAALADQFDARLHKKLTSQQLTDTAQGDFAIRLGPGVQREIEWEVKRGLTQRLLNAKGHADLLNNPWVDPVPAVGSSA